MSDYIFLIANEMQNFFRDRKTDKLIKHTVLSLFTSNERQIYKKITVLVMTND